MRAKAPPDIPIQQKCVLGAGRLGHGCPAVKPGWCCTHPEGYQYKGDVFPVPRRSLWQRGAVGPGCVHILHYCGWEEEVALFQLSVRKV